MSNEILRLTDAVANQSAYLVYSTENKAPISSAGGLSITFDFYAYGGTGADGISFFLVDGAKPIQRVGGFGGSLGYAPYQLDGIVQPGVDGGYLGIGFDEFGSYSSPTEGRTGGPGNQSDAIVVRGSQVTNYNYLSGTQLPSGLSLDNPGAGATRENSKRTAKIDLAPTGVLSVKVDLNQDGDFDDLGENAIPGLDVVANGNGTLPTSFFFGFAASTGAQTNIHEVGNFRVTAFNGTPIPGSFSGDLVIVQPGDTPSKPIGGGGNDVIETGNGNDSLVGNAGNDILIGNQGSDTLTGGTDVDRFYFRGASRTEALRSSTLRSRDRITDFRFSEGDKFGLDFDRNLETIEKPRGLFNSGKEKGKNLLKAAEAAYNDKDFKKKGDQRLKAGEAIFFRLGNSTYLSINNGRAGFSPTDDLLADVTGIQFKSGDLKKGTLKVADYFVA
ncbi:MAG: hypothetical protein MUF72_01745 [Elainella sp. Prado103]|jgi:hypothetical protein|nr:hypothetical protein [Elainella sp. Prado103]